MNNTSKPDLSLADHRFVDLLARIGSTSPSPGGGAVGALVVALAIGCGLKATRISRRHNPPSTLLAEAEGTLERLASIVLPLADADGSAFEELLRAYKLPKTTRNQAIERCTSISGAAARAASIGERINEVASDALIALNAAKPNIHANIISDYSAAVVLLEANRSIQSENIETNRDIAAKFSTVQFEERPP